MATEDQAQVLADLEVLADSVAAALGLPPDARYQVMGWMAPLLEDELRVALEAAGVNPEQEAALIRIARRTALVLPHLRARVLELLPAIRSTPLSTVARGPVGFATRQNSDEKAEDPSVSILRVASVFAWIELAPETMELTEAAVREAASQRGIDDDEASAIVAALAE